MKPLLSVIIPVYKVEEYLQKCIESVLQQKYENMEIILVDDGSPDNCGVICDEYAKKYSNIKVIHKQNGGLSSARNAGLKVARGEFISFIDSDDFVCGETLYDDLIACFLKYENVDIVQMPKKLSYGTQNELYYNLVYKDLVLDENSAKYNRFQLDKSYYTPNTNQEIISVTVWDKIYRSSVIKNIKFKDGFIFEDIIFNLSLIHKCNKIVLAATKGYYAYIERLGSITHPEVSGGEGKFTESDKNKLIAWVWSNALFYRFQVKYAYNASMQVYLIGILFQTYAISSIRRPELHGTLYRIVRNLPKPTIKYVGLYSSIKLLLLWICGNKFYGLLLKSIYKIKLKSNK